jgi:hypothetical protein
VGRRPTTQPTRIDSICTFFSQSPITDSTALENLGRPFARIHNYESQSVFDLDFVTEHLFLPERDRWQHLPSAVFLSVCTVKTLIELSYFTRHPHQARVMIHAYECLRDLLKDPIRVDVTAKCLECFSRLHRI